jgi:RecA-family ATPase
LSNQRIPSLEEIGIPITKPIEEGPPDILPGLLPKRGELVIAGETNIGKTLLALEICSSFITGTPLWGELKPTCQASKILYVLGEHYDEIVRRLWQVTKLPMTDKVIILGPEQLGYDKWLVNKGVPNPISVEKLSRWTEGVDLIVFDPLAAFVTGVDTENDNIQMRLVLDTMSLIAQGSGASVLILAHQGKPMMGKDGQEFGRKSYAIRGASGIEDAATNIFYLGKAEGTSGAAHAVGEHKVLSLKCRKYKGIAPEEYRLMRNPHTLCHTLLGNRPFTEVRKIDSQAKIGRLQLAFPDMKMSEIIKIMATVENISESTIRRYLD